MSKGQLCPTHTFSGLASCCNFFRLTGRCYVMDIGRVGAVLLLSCDYCKTFLVSRLRKLHQDYFIRWHRRLLVVHVITPNVMPSP